MNSCSLQNNSDKALQLAEKIFTNEEIISALYSDDIISKQIAIIKLDSISSTDEAKALIYNLTGQDTRIREVTSCKLNYLIANGYKDYFFRADFYPVFIDAVFDVNPNVCRNIIDFLPNIIDTTSVFALLYKPLVALIDSIPKQGNRGHDISKKIFNLYWGLEAVSCLNIPNNVYENLEYILMETALFSDYVIREKAAKILVKQEFLSEKLQKLKLQLSKDSNFYVRNCFDI